MKKEITVTYIVRTTKSSIGEFPTFEAAKEFIDTYAYKMRHNAELEQEIKNEAKIFKITKKIEEVKR